MTLLAHVVEALLIASAVVGFAAVAAFALVRRRARRYWHEVQARVATGGALTALSMLGSWRNRSAGGGRHQMWAAIEGAEEAVRHAESIDAPVAELPSVCRTLRRVGEELDQLLLLKRGLLPGRGGTDDVGAQVAEVIGAARDVQAAALRACGDATEPRIRSLVREARQEVEVVTAALARLRSVSSH